MSEQLDTLERIRTALMAVAAQLAIGNALLVVLIITLLVKL